jgi:hypothetical protein
MAPQEPQVQLTTSDANRLGKWASLWFDLLHVDVVLGDRLNTPDKPSTAFTRRALWESAVISYGRMEASTKKRNLTHLDLLKAAGGEKAVELHTEIMRWRNDHVAHRLSRDFESAAVFADYSDGEGAEPDTLTLTVSTWAGPKDNSALVVEFREHVKRLRDTLWAEYLAPIGEAIARRLRTEPSPVTESQHHDDTDRIRANLTLWSRTSGTGLLARWNV